MQRPPRPAGERVITGGCGPASSSSASSWPRGTLVRARRVVAGRIRRGHGHAALRADDGVHDADAVSAVQRLQRALGRRAAPSADCSTMAGCGAPWRCRSCCRSRCSTRRFCSGRSRLSRSPARTGCCAPRSPARSCGYARQRSSSTDGGSAIERPARPTDRQHRINAGDLGAVSRREDLAERFSGPHRETAADPAPRQRQDRRGRMSEHMIRDSTAPQAPHSGRAAQRHHDERAAPARQPRDFVRRISNDDVRG